MAHDLRHIKSELIAACKQLLEQSFSESRIQMESLRNALGSEVKSSAGDKHETGRAMIQLEMERLATRMEQQRMQLEGFERLNATQGASHISGLQSAPDTRSAAGSLVITDKGMYLIAVSLGPVAFGGHTAFVVSPASPAGQALLGKKVGDSVTFGTQTLRITALV